MGRGDRDEAHGFKRDRPAKKKERAFGGKKTHGWQIEKVNSGHFDRIQF
jgi:hypothetical protein